MSFSTSPSMSADTPSVTDIKMYSEEEVAAIAERLDKDEYGTVFGCLDDWHTLKAIAFHQPELVAPYVHLLELEVDED
ncbi:MAG: DUF2555 domain-containing protein [Synechococcus sp.]